MSHDAPHNPRSGIIGFAGDEEAGQVVLSEERRATLHALELAATLGHFETSIEELDDVEPILEETAIKLSGLVPFVSTGFYLVDEATFDFTRSWCSEDMECDALDIEVRQLVEERTFAWALGRNRPSVVKTALGTVMLHPLTTASGPVGMFVGVLQNDRFHAADIGYYLLTIVLFSSATMIENFFLYRKLREANEGLERQVENRTSELRESNEQLRTTLEEKEGYRQNLEAVFASMQDALITVNPQRRIISVNRAGEKFLGDELVNLLDSSFADVVPFGKDACLEVLARTLDHSQPVRDLRAQVSHEGVERVLMLSCSPLIGSGGDFSGAVLLIRDITRLASLEKQLRERHSFRNIIGKSKPMQDVYRLLENLADVDATVLVTGESGTGKELVAEALHHNGARADGPLVKVNCTALSENLLESELFGHVRGAFTGAVKDKAGRFEVAQGGTIFLDEIGDISLRIQVLLLRFLESKEFERVGDTRTRQADVRIVAATNADLQRKVREGSFRADLFYRLNVMNVHLPPLRKRRDDIPLLAEHLIMECNKNFGSEVTGMTDDAMSFLMRQSWDGNVRELKHALEHACILVREGVVDVQHMPPELLSLQGDSQGYAQRYTQRYGEYAPPPSPNDVALWRDGRHANQPDD